LAGVAEGALRPVVGREMKLADAKAGHEAVLQAGTYGKIVLLP
jgi:NADPH2:quinone reductase